jgi:hypothetical protein
MAGRTTAPGSLAALLGSSHGLSRPLPVPACLLSLPLRDRWLGKGCVLLADISARKSHLSLILRVLLKKYCWLIFAVQ